MRKLSKYLWFNWRITVQAIRAILARIKWKKSLLLEKLVQDKINCSNCIYILSQEYMCLWLHAAWATPPIHWIMLCCMLVKFWTACRILHTRSHHISVLGSYIARLCDQRPCCHGDPSYAVLLDRSTTRPPLPSVSKSAFVSILSITAFYFLIGMNTSLPMPMHD